MAGRLIYVVGPSGAGKDSVIASTRENINNNQYLYFAPRYVTRPSGDGHDDLAISREAFVYYKASGEFALDWEAHGLFYGVSVVIDHQLKLDKTVVVNGSRAHLATALSKYPEMTVVLITLPRAVAQARLTARAREDAAAIAARLARAPDMAVPTAQLVTIDNSGPLELAAQVFTSVLIGDAVQGLAVIPQRTVLPLKGQWQN